MIHRCFVSRNINLLTRAFITYVRPLLEYNCVAWSPHLKRDIELIEQVQRRFTKRLTPVHEEIKWPVRVFIWWTPQIVKSWQFTFTISQNPVWHHYVLQNHIWSRVYIDRDEFFQLRLSTTRGHPNKLYKHFSKCSVRSSFFSERVVNLWNSLPTDRISFTQRPCNTISMVYISMVLPLCLHSAFMNMLRTVDMPSLSL